MTRRVAANACGASAAMTIYRPIWPRCSRSGIRARPPAGGLQDRFPVVLIDEFQDTDPVQWDIVSKAFVGAVSLVLIGDPKQAIYGFRGADVTAYLKAVAAAADTWPLWSSTGEANSLCWTLWTCSSPAARFGDPRIAYRRVQAGNREPQLRGAPVAAPLRLRVVERAPDDQLSKGLLRVRADSAAHRSRRRRRHRRHAELAGRDHARAESADSGLSCRAISRCWFVRMGRRRWCAMRCEPAGCRL